MVALGYETTAPVTIEEMIHHAKAVRRAVKRAFVIGDMPAHALRAGRAEAVRCARRFKTEAGCDAVKLEWTADGPELARAITAEGIPVMGHVGLTPQAVTSGQGFKVQGQDPKTAEAIRSSALALEGAGCFSVVLECIPDRLAALITNHVKIPTIGIGAGPACSGQVLVTQDLLGLFPKMKPRFVKQYADLRAMAVEALQQFVEDVRSRRFPTQAQSYTMPDEVLQQFGGAGA
jgi:3-methyl-2-oxobutanoate hydroxymethyltransferase